MGWTCMTSYGHGYRHPQWHLCGGGVAAGARETSRDLAVGVFEDGGIASSAMEYEEGRCVGAWSAKQTSYQY